MHMLCAAAACMAGWLATSEDSRDCVPAGHPGSIARRARGGLGVLPTLNPRPVINDACVCRPRCRGRGRGVGDVGTSTIAADDPLFTTGLLTKASLEVASVVDMVLARDRNGSPGYSPAHALDTPLACVPACCGPGTC